MAVITIRGLDDEVKQRIKLRGALHGHSMEEEARIILRRAVNGISGPELLGLSEELFGKENGVELSIPSRSEERNVTDFN